MHNPRVWKTLEDIPGEVSFTTSHRSSNLRHYKEMESGKINHFNKVSGNRLDDYPLSNECCGPFTELDPLRALRANPDGQPTIEPDYDYVDKPQHYFLVAPCEKYPNGVELNDIVWQYGYNRGAVLKYTTRAGKKPGNPLLQDLRKAAKHLAMEIEHLEKEEEDASR